MVVLGDPLEGGHPEAVARRVGLCCLGARGKWWKAAECPLHGGGVGRPDDGETGLPGEISNDVAAGQEVVEGVGGGGGQEVDAPASNRMSLAAGRKEAQKRRQKCASLLQFACGLLVRDTSVRLWSGLAHFAMPLEEWFSRGMAAVKTTRGCQFFVFDICLGALQKVAYDVNDGIFSKDFAKVLDLSAFPRHGWSEHMKVSNKQVMDSMYQASVHLAGALLATSCSYLAPPLCLVLLFEAIRGACLQKCRQAWEALELMEATAIDNAQCRSLVQNTLVPESQFVREQMVRLMRCECAFVPPDVHSSMQNFARSHMSSLIVKNLFNHPRKVASHNLRHRLDPATFYHSLSVGSTVLSGFGRPDADNASGPIGVLWQSPDVGLHRGEELGVLVDTAARRDLDERAIVAGGVSRQSEDGSCRVEVACGDRWALGLVRARVALLARASRGFAHAHHREVH